MNSSRHSEADRFARALLESAQADASRAPESVRRRILWAVGAVGVTSTAVGTAAAGTALPAATAAAGAALPGAVSAVGKATTAAVGGAPGVFAAGSETMGRAAASVAAAVAAGNGPAACAGAAGGALASSATLIAVKWASAGAILAAVSVGTVPMSRLRPPSGPAPLESVATAPGSATRFAPSPRSTDAPARTAIEENASPSIDPAGPDLGSLERSAPEQGPHAAGPPSAGPIRTERPTTPAASSIQPEVATLDQARDALAAGDSGGALRILDAYAREFPNGTLRPEAMYVRFQVLWHQDDRRAAYDLGMEFLAEHPASPHGVRIRSLLSSLAK